MQILVEATSENTFYRLAANLSIQGIYLANTIPHPPGTIIDLEFILPNHKEPIKVPGEIVHVHQGGDEVGMGVKFTDLGEESTRLVSEYVESQVCEMWYELD